MKKSPNIETRRVIFSFSWLYQLWNPQWLMNFFPHLLPRKYDYGIWIITLHMWKWGKKLQLHLLTTFCTEFYSYIIHHIIWRWICFFHLQCTYLLLSCEKTVFILIIIFSSPWKFWMHEEKNFWSIKKCNFLWFLPYFCRTDKSYFIFYLSTSNIYFSRCKYTEFSWHTYYRLSWTCYSERPK